MSLARGYDWDPATGYLDALQVTDGRGETLRLGYGYDDGGNITDVRGRAYDPLTATSMTGAWCYGYEGLNRLTRAKTGSLPAGGEPATCADNGGSTALLGTKHHLAFTHTRDGLASYTDVSSGATASYAYPDGGDPAAGEPVHGVTAITQTGTDANKVMPLAGSGSISLGYDPAGRITSLVRSDAKNAKQSRGTWYSYDQQDHLTRQVTGQDSGATASSGDRTATDALYDADGIRVLRRVTTYKGTKGQDPVMAREIVEEFDHLAVRCMTALRSKYEGLVRATVVTGLMLRPRDGGDPVRAGQLEGLGGFVLHGRGCQFELDSGEDIDVDWDSDGRAVFDSWRVLMFARSAGHVFDDQEALRVAASQVPGLLQVSHDLFTWRDRAYDVCWSGAGAAAHPGPTD